MPLQIPHPNTTLHLYRHLLREATYLPPLCRPWATERIKSRFRDHRHARNPESFVKKAHHDLRYLRAANAGHIDRMIRLCWHATGRVGKRRRQLLLSSLTKPPAPDTEALESSIEQGNKRSTGKKQDGVEERDPDWLDNWDMNLLQTIAKSQNLIQKSDWPLSMHRLTDYAKDPNIPRENCWGMPFKPKSVRRRMKRYYSKILKLVIPPLPKGEWDALAALATGTADDSMSKIPSRRPVAISVDDTGLANTETAKRENKMWDWEKYVTKPVRALERNSSRRMKALTGEEDVDPRGQGRPIGVFTFKPRLLQRKLYGRVWETSSIVNKTAKGKWEITWGGSPKVPTPPSQSDLQFFAGVDAKGRLIKSNV